MSAPAGRFQIIRELGRGAMGSVHEAQDTVLGRRVALKLLIQRDRKREKRFEVEASALARLSHPNIVGLHEVTIHENKTCLVMEFVNGQDLSTVLADGPMDPRAAAVVAREVALALHTAHELGVLHRDVKPGNILLSAEGPAKLTDFGLAKDKSELERLTETGQIVGTPSFMAPEQLGAGDLDARTDVYGLGATLYALLTGEPPFPSDSMPQLVGAILSVTPISPSRHKEGVPRDLSAVCLKCLSKDPAERYATAQDLAADLKRHLSNEAVRARSGSSLRSAIRVAKRRWPLSIAIGVACFSIAAALTFTAKSQSQVSARRPETSPSTPPPPPPQDPPPPKAPAPQRVLAGQPLLTLPHTGALGAEFLPDDPTRAISWGGFGVVKLWELSRGYLVETFQIMAPVADVTAAPAHRLLAAARVSRYTVRSLKAHSKPNTWRSTRLKVDRVAWSLDASTLILGGEFGALAYASAPEWRSDTTPRTPLLDPVQALTVSPDGQWLVALTSSDGRSRNQAHLIDMTTRQVVKAWDFLSRPLAVAFAPNSKQFVVGSSAGYVETIDFVNDRRGATMIHPDTSVRGSAHRSRVRGLAHSETRVYSITGEHLERLKNWNNELRIWDAQTGEHLGTHLSSRLTRYTSIALSADESKLLITATDSNQVTLWHVDSLR